MGSHNTNVQLAQKERLEKELGLRLATLTKDGLSKEQTDKDTTVRRIRADIKAIRKRMMAGEQQLARYRKAAEDKAARLAAPKVAKKKAKGEAAPAPSDKKKKKEKAKEAPAEE
jgi:hypothetical protein